MRRAGGMVTFAYMAATALRGRQHPLTMLSSMIVPTHLNDLTTAPHEQGGKKDARRPMALHQSIQTYIA